ncbi:MAG: hypothetical protein M1608_11525 [Candidatus Omnitrophica bacterium]|nr:hypothetical protein [Candidatus Omnitrophota bacterium]
MKNNKEAKKEQTAKTQTPTPTAAPKTAKARKEPAVKVEKDEEPADRLPTSLDELKESKSGLVTFLFLSGKEQEDIAKELGTAFVVERRREPPRETARTGSRRF